MDERDLDAIHLERFSDIIWSLCAANSVLPLIDASMNKCEYPLASDLLPEILLTALVFLSILRNYSCNRRIAQFLNLDWRKYKKHVPGPFIWWLTAYVGFWFLVGALQNRPEMVTAALATASLVGFVVVRMEKRFVKAANDAKPQGDTPRKGEHVVLEKLHRNWSVLDVVVFILSAVAAYLLWGDEILRERQGIWAPIGILVLLNVVDLVVHRDFYFRPADKCLGTAG